MTTIKNFSEGDKVQMVSLNGEEVVTSIGTVTQVAKNRKYVWVELPSSDGTYRYVVKVTPDRVAAV